MRTAQRADGETSRDVPARSSGAGYASDTARGIRVVAGSRDVPTRPSWAGSAYGMTPSRRAALSRDARIDRGGMGYAVGTALPTNAAATGDVPNRR